MQPTAPAGAFLKAGDFEECFPDLSVSLSQGRRLMGRALDRRHHTPTQDKLTLCYTHRPESLALLLVRE